MTMPAIRGSRLFGGRALNAGPEPFAEHTARLGPLPSGRDRQDLIPALEASGLLGRGGGGFPVGRKWRTVAERSGGRAIVLANGAEGEPLSAKDRAVMTLRPHAVLDGALLAADVVGADEVILYIGGAHAAARRSMSEAIAQRSLDLPVQIVAAPDRYVAGEESAAVHFVNDGDARPTSVPPRPYERGVAGLPTLVQNVESLAYAGLIARFGTDRYSAGTGTEPGGIGLITIAGTGRPGVREIDLGTPVGEIVSSSGGRREESRAFLLGGYFGRWVSAAEAWDLPFEPTGLRAAGLTFGCGVISVLGADACGVRSTSTILDYLADQSAAQCGPCVFGLRAIADATARLAHGAGASDDLARIERWAGELAGRGACRHPDGAAGLLHSALCTFGEEFSRHARARTCSAGGRPAQVA